MYCLVAATLAWFALVAQLFLTTATVVAQERSVLAGVITFLSFFTILTNLLTAAALTGSATLADSRLSGFFDRPATQGAIATYITVVGIVYSLLLRQLWQPQGLQLLVDSILHDVIPIAFVIQWFVFVPKGQLQWRHALMWLSYPFVYVVYSLLRGAVSGRYPYPFSDVSVLGYPKVFENTAMLLVGFFVLGLVFVAVDRFLGARRRSAG
ncbi:MAG: hypothetical protein DLM53_11090 [Candidatus Eremiobacter antarcticus]|nr:MAG: hypothetical protein DLM53_11090 [Candidatus Eremiobacter sp. RRmetagenome_bin22]